MRRLFPLILLFFLIFILLHSEVNASEKKPNTDNSKIFIANKFAEQFCSAKGDNFFKGLDNEKTLKFSYFKFIISQSKQKLTKDMNKLLIDQISEKCNITDEDEKDLNEFILKESKTNTN